MLSKKALLFTGVIGAVLFTFILFNKEALDKEAAKMKSKPDTIHALKKYKDVIQMIDSTNDYHTENGTLKLISNAPLHIQVAKKELAEEPEENIKDQINRNIISVGFRIFAQTDLNEIIITSTALQHKNNKPIRYLDEYKKTYTLKRDKLKQLLIEYYDFSEFEKLFGEDIGEGVYSPNVANEYLRKMMFNDQGEPTLNSVIEEIRTNN